MKYKTVLVAERAAGCNRVSLDAAFQKSLDQHSAQGYVLVQAYQQQQKVGCQSEVGAVLIFARP